MLTEYLRKKDFTEYEDDDYVVCRSSVWAPNPDGRPAPPCLGE
jgi:hypothetical protein